MDDLSPDFKTACEKANEILVCSNVISTFPYSMYKVIEEFTEIEQRPFSSISGHSLTATQIVGSDDGGLFSDGSGNYLMFYNEKMPQTRLRFTGGHECGHYMMGHDMELITDYRQKKDTRFEPLYEKYELESNMFAAQLLMPEQIIIELSKRGCRIDEAFLEKTFNVSNKAARIRKNNLRKVYDWYSLRQRMSDYTLSYDDIILEKFKNFIDSVAPKKHSYEYDFEKELEMERKRQSWL